MPLYEYKHLESGEIIEVFRSMKDEHPEIIEQDGKTYHRVYSVGAVTVDLVKGRTIGSVAAKNTEKLRKQGKLLPKKEKYVPWWRKDKKKPDLSLANMSAKQKRQYIIEGKK